MLVGWHVWLYFQPFSLIPGDQLWEIVAIGTVAPERVLIEKPLNAATGTNLVGTALSPDGPAHFAMPASPKDDGGTRQPGRKQADRPKPAGTLVLRRLRFFFHYHLTCAKPLPFRI
jgi:hypothetical protein